MKLSSSFTVVIKTSSLQLPSLAGTLIIKSMLQSAPKHFIFILKIQKIFWGGGTAPFPDPSSTSEGDTLSPDPTHLASARFSRLWRSAFPFLFIYDSNIASMPGKSAPVDHIPTSVIKSCVDD